MLIWFSMLEAGASKKCDVLFVTGEEKPDWWHRSDNEELFPRIELVDEYRRASSGKTFAMCKLSTLLRLFKVEESAIADTQRSELQQEEELRAREVETQTIAQAQKGLRSAALALKMNAENVARTLGAQSGGMRAGVLSGNVFSKDVFGGRHDDEVIEEYDPALDCPRCRQRYGTGSRCMHCGLVDHD
ncbi:hypothetical protein BE18_19475 [Sorangium cellulosum]|uniref:PIN like domain-containing protein n=1 Tax=Sorangium cellulosum TaxID=56 RepID=A0A150RCE8_SORCE|nr:hypothetical protein BE18_19475 [Sorangium cellulosum]